MNKESAYDYVVLGLARISAACVLFGSIVAIGDDLAIGGLALGIDAANWFACTLCLEGCIIVTGCLFTEKLDACWMHASAAVAGSRIEFAFMIVCAAYILV
jgi:hypothetical protein